MDIVAIIIKLIGGAAAVILGVEPLTMRQSDTHCCEQIS